MKIRLSGIPKEGITLSEQFDPAGMKLERPEFTLQGPLIVTATFRKELDAVLVEVEARGEMSETCGRCLEVYRRPYEGRFDFGYSVKGRMDLDVTDDIRQEIILSYPVRYVCREECLGLCSQCGANLNEGVCVHGTTEASFFQIKT